MATLVLAAAGSAIGASIGGGILGISSVVIGQAVGAVVGRMIDQRLFGPSQTVEGARMEDLSTTTAAEGGGLPVIHGRGMVAGTLIWATRLEEVKSEETDGGKGLGSGGSTTTISYKYYANFAVALCEGPTRSLGRVWADGKPLDTSKHTIRFHRGTETQSPDSLIVAKDGDAPAYLGVAYAVFERFDVTDFGGRIPSLKFEVYGPAGEMETLVRGVDLIPGTTEFGYSPTKVVKTSGDGSKTPENARRFGTVTDWNLSLDQMEATLPNADTVALVVSWFGTDLRADHCQIEPRVEDKTKTTDPAWSVAGLTRASATRVSLVDGKPAFGSTPDDQSVIDAIQDLKARGKRVVLYPFLMMDIPSGNTLPDPDTGTAGQSVYPWRGRIRKNASGGTAAAQAAAILGNAAPSDFPAGSGVPSYTGPSEWSYRRFILHLAALARAAGGVDAFLIGSEMVGLTTMTGSAGSYPFVTGLASIASDVKSMLPAADISYAADWSEYHSHQTGPDLYFHLDTLWSSPGIDFIGIDNYLPMSDWRPGTDHLDYDPASGHTSPYSLDYLKSQIEGGEYWDWYYLSAADRDAQIRTPITDGAHGEPWVYRPKAIRDWHANAHHNRPGGVRDATATGWVPGSKPIWFTEFGCPAVDLGTNQPNVFYDPKSSESFLPHFSAGRRDDFIQRQYLRAMIEWWSDNGGATVSPANMLVWCWDARPWPEFPRDSDYWVDGDNLRWGHWLNGRAGAAPAAEVMERFLVDRYGLTAGDFDLSDCYGQADGIILPDPLTFRELLATWETALRVDASEYGGMFRIASRAGAKTVVDLTPDDLVEVGSDEPYRITRGSLEETPRRATIRFYDQDRDYQTGAAQATIRHDAGEAEATANLALVSDVDRMTSIAETILRTSAEERETVEFTLPPSTALVPGNAFTFTPRNGRPLSFVVEEIARGTARRIRAKLFYGAAYGAAPGVSRPGVATVGQASLTVVPILMDLPILPGVTMEDHQGFVALAATPWPGGGSLYRSTDQDTGFSLNVQSGVPAHAGTTGTDLAPPRAGLWQRATLTVTLASGTLVSRPEIDVLNGANVLAVEHAPGDWEVIQYLDAEFISTGTWRLSGLLRGQLGTDAVIDTAAPLASGARVVVLDTAVLPVTMQGTHVGAPLWYRAAPYGADPAEDIVTPVAHTFTAVGRRPYAPAHLAADIDGSTLSLSWFRRTRIDGDAWTDSGEVPLGEAFERYLVEIGPDESPVISVTVEDATVADLDVSAITGTQEVRVRQIGETYGPGAPARLSVAF